MLKPTPRVEPPSAQGACKDSLRVLFESEETPLLRYAFSLTGRRAVAEEIVQDVFMQLHMHWSDIEAPKAWLMRSVRNKALDCLRKNKREVLLNEEGRASMSYADDVTPEALIQRMEAAAALRQMMQELSPTDRQLVELKYFDGLKYSDISRQTGLSISNVGYRLHHILKELAAKLLPLGIDGKS